LKNVSTLKRETDEHATGTTGAWKTVAPGPRTRATSSDGGKVSLSTQSGTHLIADRVGWYAA
jgi:hypothetical protein